MSSSTKQWQSSFNSAMAHCETGYGVGLAGQCFMRRALGDDLPVRQVPPLRVLVPQVDVSGVYEVFAGALPVPHLVPGVPRVLENGGDRSQRPPRAGAVRVPAWAKRIVARIQPDNDASERVAARLGM